MTNLRPIRNEEDYETALEEIEALWAAEPYLGSRARVSEILNRRRPLSLEMIRKLQSGLGLPADVLVQPYALQGTRHQTVEA